jgi:D-sedoheptulose 7-phosphate isomerase
MKFNEYADAHLELLKMIESDDLVGSFKILNDLLQEGGTLWVAGNGGSSSSASHASTDFTKTIRRNGRSLRTISLSDFVALNSAYSNDLSFEENFQESLKALAKSGDALLIISVSGMSANLVNCFNAAQEMGLKTISLVGVRGAEIRTKSDAGVMIPSDDYQIVENIHMMIIHWFTKMLLCENTSSQI